MDKVWLFVGWCEYASGTLGGSVYSSCELLGCVSVMNIEIYSVWAIYSLLLFHTTCYGIVPVCVEPSATSTSWLNFAWPSIFMCCIQCVHYYTDAGYGQTIP